MAIPIASLVVVIMYISPVFVCQYGLLGLDTAYLLGFRACPGSFLSSPIQNIQTPRHVGKSCTKHPDPKAGRPLDPDKPGCITSCWGGETDPDYSRPFLWIFVPEPRLLQPTLVIGSAVGSAPVEQGC